MSTAVAEKRFVSDEDAPRRGPQTVFLLSRNHFPRFIDPNPEYVERLRNHIRIAGVKIPTDDEMDRNRDDYLYSLEALDHFLSRHEADPKTQTLVSTMHPEIASGEVVLILVPDVELRVGIAIDPIALAKRYPVFGTVSGVKSYRKTIGL